MHAWDHIQERIQVVRQGLVEHRVYSLIEDLHGVQCFMESHVYAVWDFMSLLKALQRELCCTSVPWVPPKNATLARLINEIVLAEESDLDANNNSASHFDLYHSSMKQAGADTTPVDQFLTAVREGSSLQQAYAAGPVPEAARKFIDQTFSVIESGHLPSIAAAFTFGREDLLPELFTQVIAGISESSEGSLSEFIYYLDRHVALDGDEHGPLAKQLVITLCGDNQADWELAENAVVASLESRLALWDALACQIESMANSAT